MTFARIICILLGILFVPLIFLFPYAIAGIAVALFMVIYAFAFLGAEAVTTDKRSVAKTFICPFRKADVEVKFRPSFFTFREYDDVLKCSAFKGKVTCKKKCLDLPEFHA